MANEVAWESKDGLLKGLSVGKCGVWGVNQDDDIYHRSGTYGLPLAQGHKEWTHIGGKLKQLSCGNDIVWGVNADDDIFVRVGITHGNPNGTDWKNIGGKLKHISVCPTTHEV